MIHLQDINKTYQGAQPLHVLKGISLDIAKGEFVSIMGASGSGKSTLLNILGILDNYDSGTYELAGVPILNLSETKAAEYRNKMIGFIFQSFNLISFKTAVENVELPLFYQGVSRKKRHQMALASLLRPPWKTLSCHYFIRECRARSVIRWLWSIWSVSDCGIGQSITLMNCREDRNNAWQLPEHSSPVHRSSWPTSLRVHSTRRPLWR